MTSHLKDALKESLQVARELFFLSLHDVKIGVCLVDLPVRVLFQVLWRLFPPGSEM